MTDTKRPQPFRRLSNNRAFWQFHGIFWIASTIILFLSGLSQGFSFVESGSRNLLYGVAGFCACIALIPILDKPKLQHSLKLLFIVLSFSYFLGSAITLVVNAITNAIYDYAFWQQPWPRWFGGSLNFSLVVLVWTGLYLAFKKGLFFLDGDEEQEVAKAVSSISSISTRPDFLALERNKKIVLMPVNSVLAIKASGDYIEIITEDGTFLKRESMISIIEQLDPTRFYRVHRSAIININSIKEMEPKGKGDYRLILESGIKIDASRSYMKDFSTQFYGIRD